MYTENQLKINGGYLEVGWETQPSQSEKAVNRI